MKKGVFFVLLSGLMMASCSNVEKQAQPILDDARQAYEQGNLDLSKQLIDTIKVLYPKAFKTRKAGLQLEMQVETARQQRIVASMDSIISEKTAEFEALKPKFTLDKDTAYQQVGNYIVPSQVIEKNLHRSFLRFQVDEQGKLSMTSIYCGKSNIHHTGVKVIAPDKTFAETLASKDSYETADMGEKIEKADYKLGEDGGVIEFVATNSDKNLRVEYAGDRSYATTMTPADRKAAYEVSRLAAVLDALNNAKEQKAAAQQKIDFIKEKQKHTDYKK